MGDQKATVVNVRTDEYDIYIGRANRAYGLSASKWANPFRLRAGADDDEREQCIEQYREYLATRPDLLAQIGELKGKRLACWCKPGKRCHGDVLAALADGQDAPAISPESAAAERFGGDEGQSEGNQPAGV